MNISEALTRMRLVFPSQRIPVLTDIPQPTHWSADQTLRWEQTEEEAGNVSHLSTQDMPAVLHQFSLHLKFTRACKTQISNVNS